MTDDPGALPEPSKVTKAYFEVSHSAPSWLFAAVRALKRMTLQMLFVLLTKALHACYIVAHLAFHWELWFHIHFATALGLIKTLPSLCFRALSF